MNKPCLQLDLLALPKAVPELRRAVREHLGVPCADVELCVTELVGNVIRHVGEGTPVRVRVTCGSGRIRIEVDDPYPHALPVVLHAAEGDESGRGLALLDAVVLRWGVELRDESKTVWCELGDSVDELARGRTWAATAGIGEKPPVDTPRPRRLPLRAAAADPRVG